MPTYALTCTVCGEPRWPQLAVRPAKYICTRCTVTGPTKVVARRERGIARSKPRPGTRMTQERATE